MIVCFFFQAEDGIRDYKVTGVQTCALPIYKIVFDDLKNNATMAAMLAYAASEDTERTSRELTTLPPLPNGNARAWPKCGTARSEERRVGKECGAGRAADR